MSEIAHGHEAHAEASGGRWEKGILSVLKGLAFGLALVAIAPSVVMAAPLIIPTYMTSGLVSGIVPGVIGGVIGAKLVGTGKAEGGKAAKKDSHGH